MRFQKLSLVVVLAAWGCSGNDSVNIGDNQAPRTKTGELLSDYAASWDGYAEAFEFQSGSDHLQIELDEAGHGTVVFGEGTPPAPATDPDDWYSPFGFYPGQGHGNPDGQLGEGVAYTVQRAEVHDKRVKFAIDPNEVYESWCELQVPIRDTTGDPAAPEYGCVPYQTSNGGDDDRCYYNDYVTGQEIEENCARLEYCAMYGLCACTADGCTVAPLDSPSAWEIDVDAALDDGGDALVGTMIIGERVTVRMKRQ